MRMRDELIASLEKLKSEGLVDEAKEARMRKEIDGPLEHRVVDRHYKPKELPGLYNHSDMEKFYDYKPMVTPEMNLKSLEELLKRDEQREKDGFPKKIRLGKIARPGIGGKQKIIVVPTTQEEKFVHDELPDPEYDDSEEESDDGEFGGTGDEGEGEGGAGSDDGGNHDVESNAYEIGKILTEKFKLPNLQDKGKKKAIVRYKYDLTDKNRGSGQVLDKKDTLREIIKKNLGLGRIADIDRVDTSSLLIDPNDMIYQIMSREIEFESQALVLFLRDYSGSMWGSPTEIVVHQHLYLYSWLMYQYKELVETRFAVHDMMAKEVPDFYTYYNIQAAGGTKIVSGIEFLNDIVEKENLAKDYNIYVFYGTDGDDWPDGSNKLVTELERMLGYVNRLGVTVVGNGFNNDSDTEFEKQVNDAKLIETYPNLMKLNKIGHDGGEDAIIEGIKHLVSEDGKGV